MSDPLVKTSVGLREGFVFSGQPRKIERVLARHFRWPKCVGIANEYIFHWHSLADGTLAEMKLSRKTLDQIASHISRRDGILRLTDMALSSRSGRSLTSTKRDIQRLKLLGLIICEYQGGSARQERVRLLKLAVPDALRSGQRIPHAKMDEVGPTYTPYVGPIDMGDRRNV